MTRYSISQALPLPGSSAALLTAAVGARSPARLSRLAQEAGISKFAASRAAAALAEAGLLAVTDDGHYRFASDHPMATTVTELAWRLNGVTPPDLDRHHARTPFAATDDHYAYRALIPPSLRINARPHPRLAEPVGPSLIKTRDLITSMQPVFADFAGYWDNAQEVYSRWHTERLRDIIHQLHFSEPLAAATTTLSGTCTADAQGEADPWEACIPGHHWVRAAFLMSASAEQVSRLVEVLLQAIEIGRRIDRHRYEAIYLLEQVNYKPASEHVSTWVDKARTEAAEAARLWSAPPAKGEPAFHHIGGTPRPSDVGTAGDQILAVELLATLRRLIAAVADMAAHPSVDLWRSLHPDEASWTLMTSSPHLPS